MIAKKWGFSRARLDEYRRAVARTGRGGASTTAPSTDQIVPVLRRTTPRSSTDEGMRRGTTAEKLAGLKPAFARTA